jgi:thiol-disulfide isomerase/thioredoxin
MKFLQLILLGTYLLAGPSILFGQKHIPVLNFEQLDPYLHCSDDTLYIINFWATWCIPCRKELPVFEKIHQEYRNQPVKVLLVSLDFPDRISSSLIPFIREKNITAEVVVLNDPNSNAWIDRVNPSWSGALPATLLYRGKTSIFREEQLEYSDIENLIRIIKTK